MPYLKRINSLPLINHISYKYAQVSDIGPSWSSCSSYYLYICQSHENTESFAHWETVTSGLDLNNSLADDRILDQSKMKDFADDKISLTQKLYFVFGKVENILGKGENADY